MPSLYGYSGLFRAGDPEIGKSALFSLKECLKLHCLPRKYLCALGRSDLPHRFSKVLVCNIILFLVSTFEIACCSDGRTAGCDDTL